MHAPREITIAGWTIAQGSAPFVIAEIGVNHDGSLARGCELIDAAATAGANAVKLQVFRADRLVTRDAPTADYQAAAGAGSSQHRMLEALELSLDECATLVERARHHGLAVLATPFDIDAAVDVAHLGVDAIKIGSGDLTYDALLRRIADLGRPVLCSTGMADLDATRHAHDVLRRAGCTELALLHCVSAYPAPLDDANLRAISSLHRAFGCPVGWSDHVPGTTAAIAAVALGAPIFERHLTHDRSARGPDHAASDDPSDFATYVAALQGTHRALGDGVKRARAAERDVAVAARRSLVSSRRIIAGTVIEPQMLDVRRPGGGFAPDALHDVAGRRAACDIPADVRIEPGMLQ